jgi:hypothetical protein
MPAACAAGHIEFRRFAAFLQPSNADLLGAECFGDAHGLLRRADKQLTRQVKTHHLETGTIEFGAKCFGREAMQAVRLDAVDAESLHARERARYVFVEIMTERIELHAQLTILGRRSRGGRRRLGSGSSLLRLFI